LGLIAEARRHASAVYERLRL